MTETIAEVDKAKRVLELRAEGRTVREIAREIGARTSYVSAVLVNEGFAPPRMSPQTKSRVLELRREGKTVSAIAKEVGYQPASIAKLCRKHGLNEPVVSGGRNPWTKDEKKYLESRIENNVTPQAIARQLGRPLANVRETIIRLGLPLDYYVDIRVRERVIKMRHRHMSAQHIAEQLSIDKMVVLDILHTAGLNKRQPSKITIDGDVAYVSLTRGLVARVSTSDIPLLENYKWFTTGPKNKPYAAAKVGGRVIHMHRHITSAPPDRVVDHANHQTLDNRRENLRVVTIAENALNARIGNVGTGLRGVRKLKNGRYAASIRIHLGEFNTEEEAYSALIDRYRTIYGPEFRLAAKSLAKEGEQ